MEQRPDVRPVLMTMAIVAIGLLAWFGGRWLAETFVPGEAQSTLTSAQANGICARAEGLITDEPDKALALIDSYRDYVGGDSLCADQRAAAVLNGAREETGLESAAGTWNDVVTRWLLTSASLIGGVLGFVVAGLVLARLLALLPGTPWVRLGSRARRAWWWVGLATLLAGATLAVGVLANAMEGISRADAPSFAVLTGFSAVALIVGPFLLSLAFAARLAIRINAIFEGNASAEDSADLAARLFELGAAPPRGLEIPRETDASAQFEKILPGETGISFASVLRSVWGLLFGGTPWTATANIGGAGTGTLELSRNGRDRGSQTVDFAEMELPVVGDGRRYVLKMMAGLVVASLAREHPREFLGLCEASDGRSIGLQYIATTELKGLANVEIAKRYLAAALDHDKENRPALVALMHNHYRDATSADELRHYADWLFHQSHDIAIIVRDDASKLSGYVNLRRRVLLTYFVVVRNLRAVTGSVAWPGSGVLIEMRELLEQLLSDENEKRIGRHQRAVSEGYLQQARSRASGLLQDMEGVPPLDPSWSWKRSPGARESYNAACARAVLARPVTPDEEVTLKEQLRTAFTNDELKQWGRRDPELASLRARPSFAALFGLPRDVDEWELPVLAAVKPQLERLGIATVRQFLDADSPTVRGSLSLTREQYAYLRRVARVVRALESSETPALGMVRNALLRDLLDAGLSDLCDWPRRRDLRAYSAVVTDRISTRLVIPVDEIDVYDGLMAIRAALRWM